MTLTITSLRVDHRVTPQGNVWIEDIPFTIVNCTFRITDDEHFLERTKADASEYNRVLTVASPEDYEAALANWDFTFKNGYDFGRAWTTQEPPFYYLEKFDTFHFREFVADSTVTRAIIAELEYFKEHGKLPSVYRHVEESVVISLLHMLHRLWD